MIKGKYDKVGARTLAAAVINRAYKDLLHYNEADRDELERQIKGGSIDLYLDLLNTTLTPLKIIEKARQKRKEKKNNGKVLE